MRNVHVINQHAKGNNKCNNNYTTSRTIIIGSYLAKVFDMASAASYMDTWILGYLEWFRSS